jgi:hypothetical protein
MKKSYIILQFLCVCFLFSCKKDEPAPSTNEPKVNPYKENGAAYILNQKEFPPNMTIYKLVPSGDGNFYFYGYKANYTVGKMSASGIIMWEYNPEYEIRTIAAYNNRLIVIGNRDFNNDNAFDLGYVSVIDNGQKISQLEYDDYDNIQLNDVAENKIVGRCLTGGFIYPILLDFTLNDQILSKNTIKYFQNMPYYRFGNIDKGYIYTLNVDTKDFSADINAREYMIVKLDNNKNVEWTRTIPLFEQGYQMVFWDILVHNNTVYVAGSTEIKEEVEPSNGSKWTAATLVSIASTGELLYAKKYNPSKYDDGYNQLVAEGDIIYAAGTYAHVIKGGTAYLGYGMLSKIVATTGNVLEDKYFGSDQYRSGYNTLTLYNARLYAAGYTQQKVYGQYGGWFCELLKF